MLQNDALRMMTHYSHENQGARQPQPRYSVCDRYPPVPNQGSANLLATGTRGVSEATAAERDDWGASVGCRIRRDL